MRLGARAKNVMLCVISRENLECVDLAENMFGEPQREQCTAVLDGFMIGPDGVCRHALRFEMTGDPVGERTVVVRRAVVACHEIDVISAGAAIQ